MLFKFGNAIFITFEMPGLSLLEDIHFVVILKVNNIDGYSVYFNLPIDEIIRAKNDHIHDDGKVRRSSATPIKLFSCQFF